MPDYDLSVLSDDTFEALIQALASKVIGSNVMPFGPGPDGGRDATFDGKVDYPSSENPWEGYGVIQAKFLEKPRNSTYDGQWAVRQLTDELEKYLRPESNLRKPEYFVFATNVALSAVRLKGSKDRMIALLDSFKDQISLKGYAIWDYDQIRVFLDANESIRRSYAAWITPGDVLAEVMTWLQPKTPDFEDTITTFLQTELLSDQFVNLEQAGHSADERIPLARVFVDLHTRADSGNGTSAFDDLRYDRLHRTASGREESGFIKEMLEVSSNRLDPQSQYAQAITQNVESADPPRPQGRYVLIGGPGQGKTTVGQFICQIFRTVIISRKPVFSLSPETQNALTSIARHCEDEGIERTPVPRFPFRIVLNEFATALSSESSPEVNSIWSFISDKISKRTNRSVLADDVRSWIGQYPSVIIFDGLDEVPSSSNREAVLRAIQDFWIDASNVNADILSIATSRPQGYNRDFSPDYYEHRALVPLSPQLGRHFAERLADVRYGTDLDRKAKVLGRLERAFENNSTSRLMRSPLQVTIMTALVDTIGQPPQLRWNLFKSYYDVIFQREVERAIPASDILRSYKPDINAIHSRVALLLHIDSERRGRTDAKLSAERFQFLVEARLKEEGHQGKELQELTEQIFAAALERLVFLVGLEPGQIGFEIRSLQEFMAAECLMEGSDQEVGLRLKEISPIPYWRNVFLFASGKCFAERQHLRANILSICAELNDSPDDPIAKISLTGSVLAIDLLDDGLSRHQPVHVREFARIAMRVLEVPDPQLHSELCDCYEPALQDIYHSEISLRINDHRKYVRMAAWRCVVLLADAGHAWAADYADEYWPEDRKEQFEILTSADTGDPLGDWSARKCVELLPLMPMRRVLSEYGTLRIDSVQLTEKYRSMLSMLNGPIGSLSTRINCLHAKLDLPTIHMSDRSFAWLNEFKSLDGWHVSWSVYKAALDFTENPSKEKLSETLRSLVQWLEDDPSHNAIGPRLVLPWPLLACLSMCNDESDLSKMAERAASGELGDVQDWIAAENRWIERGVVLDDFLAMPDHRLPFDKDIAHNGFPTTLPLRPPLIRGEEDRFLFDAVHIHSQVPKGTSRAFVANMVHAKLSHAAWGRYRYDGIYADGVLPEPFMGFNSIFEDLDPSIRLPLSVLIKEFRGTDSEIANAFAALLARGHKFEAFRRLGRLTREDLLRVCEAYAPSGEQSALLPVIGALAEEGLLTSDMVRVPAYEHTDNKDHKIAKLMCLIAFETWQSDQTDQLMHLMQDVELQSVEVYDKVLHAVSQNRSKGPFLDQFLVRLDDCLPDNDHEMRELHASVIDDRLRERMSKFADPLQFRNFNPPAGLIELLMA